VGGFILLLRLKNKNKVFKKSVNYFLALMKDANIYNIFVKIGQKRKIKKLCKGVLPVFWTRKKNSINTGETPYHSFI